MDRRAGTGMARDLKGPQQWALRRFAGISPCHFGFPVRIVSMAGLVAPPGFEPVWRSIPLDATGEVFSDLMSENIPALQALLLLFHPFKKAELTRVCELVEVLQDAIGDQTPPIFWISHTVAPESSVGAEGRGFIFRDVARIAQECGIEDITKQETSGFRLALDVRTMITKTLHLTNAFTDVLAREEYNRQQKAKLENLVHMILWEYLIVKAGDGSIPQLDRNIPEGIPEQLFGWTVGVRLGSGFFGSVYLITRDVESHCPEDSKRVLKAMAKSNLTTLGDLTNLQRSFEFMRQLSNTWRHPNIVRLFGAYQSRSHVLLTIEYAGPRNLFKRLLQREKPPGEGCCPLSPKKVCSIIAQALAAVTHMHTGPEICHRDLKPENFIVREEPNEPDLQLKLADFDIAASMKTPCRSPRGSLPFVAPEVILTKQYEGGPADIWSLSVVMLEVLCRTRILERALRLGITPQGEGNRVAVVSEIARYFAAEGSTSHLLNGHGRLELAEVLPVVTPVLQQTMTVDPACRLDARQLSAALEGLAA